MILDIQPAIAQECHDVSLLIEDNSGCRERLDYDRAVVGKEFPVDLDCILRTAEFGDYADPHQGLLRSLDLVLLEKAESHREKQEIMCG